MVIARTTNQPRCPKCGSNLLRENLDGDLECADCGKVLYRQPQQIVKEAEKEKQPRLQTETKEPELKPIFVDKAGRKYWNGTPGRKLEGEWRECKICGEPIYIRPYRLKLKRKTNGEYCSRCFKKIILPILARLPRIRSKVNTKLTTKQSIPMVSSMNVNTASTEQELALRCLQCSSLKTGGGIFRCGRERCKYD